jgi:hypothetical protein
VENVNIHSPYVCAALISASQPRLDVRACRLREYTPRNQQDRHVTAAVITDKTHTMMDALISSDNAGAAVLRKRFTAAQTVTATKQIGLYDFDVQTPLAIGTASDVDGHEHTVMLSKHVSGQALTLSRLGDLEASSLGAGLASIHRTDISYLLKKGRHGISGPAMHVELENWIHSLALQNVIPQSIISRWNQLVSIDGLWKFTTVLTHGDMKSGDALFEPHRGLSALMNWENWKISDPARDFAWLYGSGVDEHERNLVLSGYGRVMGSLEDPRIVPRARLWAQMAIVRDFLSALDSGDHDAIVSARTAVSQLASSLQPVIAVSPGNPALAGRTDEKTGTRLAHASAPTITVGKAKENSPDQAHPTDHSHGEAHEHGHQANLSSLLSTAAAPTSTASTPSAPVSSTSTPTSTPSSSTITVGTLLHPSRTDTDIREEFDADHSDAPEQSQAQHSQPEKSSEEQSSDEQPQSEQSQPDQSQPTSSPQNEETEGETTSFDAAGFAQGIGRPLAARVHIKDKGSVHPHTPIPPEEDIPTRESQTSAPTSAERGANSR